MNSWIRFMLCTLGSVLLLASTTAAFRAAEVRSSAQFALPFAWNEDSSSDGVAYDFQAPVEASGISDSAAYRDQNSSDAPGSQDSDSAPQPVEESSSDPSKSPDSPADDLLISDIPSHLLAFPETCEIWPIEQFSASIRARNTLERPPRTSLLSA